MSLLKLGDLRLLRSDYKPQLRDDLVLVLGAICSRMMEAEAGVNLLLDDARCDAREQLRHLVPDESVGHEARDLLTNLLTNLAGQSSAIGGGGGGINEHGEEAN